MIIQITETACEIQDDLKQTVTTLTGIEDSKRMKQQILNQLQHLAYFKLVRGLTNTSTNTDMLQFRSLFSVVLSKKQGKHTLEESGPGCFRTGNHFDTCFHPECVVTITPSESLYLQVQNKANEHELPIYVYAFAMNCFDWEIEDLLKASRDVIPPKESRYGNCEVGAAGAFNMRIDFGLDEGQESCEDIVKVFITTQPTSFATIAMPKLGLRASYEEPVLRKKRGGRESEDWAALTFRVRVVERSFK